MSFKFKVGDRVVCMIDVRHPEAPPMRGVVTRCYTEPKQVNPGNHNIVYAFKPEVYSVSWDPPHENVCSDGRGRYAMQLESEYDGKLVRIDD